MTGNAFDASPLIIGHRGAAGLLPENTLPSFMRAVELGVGAVELDVHRCQDELVVIHDDTLERTTNGRGAVARQSLVTLKQLDAGGGAEIPTLEQVFAALPVEVGVNVELKGKNTAEFLASWLPTFPERDILLSSFDHAALRSFRQFRSDYPVAPLFGRWRNDAAETALDFGSGYINVGSKLVTSARMARIQAAGLRVLVYTVNDLEEAKRLFDLGVWGIFTDYPDRIASSLL